MLEDKERWNKKYLNAPMPNGTSDILKEHIHLATVGKAIDIACGTGRNTHFMADRGFIVDAVDLSDYALERVEDRENINKIEADLDEYQLQADAYDLIVKINYLERRLFPSIIKGLKKGGIFIYETFLEIDRAEYHNPTNPDFLLAHNELPEAFRDLEILLYEERDAVNLRGEKVKVASFVAKRV